MTERLCGKRCQFEEVTISGHFYYFVQCLVWGALIASASRFIYCCLCSADATFTKELLCSASVPSDLGPRFYLIRGFLSSINFCASFIFHTLKVISS